MKKKDLLNIGKNNGIQLEIIEKIIMKVTGLSKKQLFLLGEIDDNYKNQIVSKLEQIKKGKALEYVIKESDFFGLNFYVDKRVLIPRDDTEILVLQAIKQIKNKKNITLIDIGTGTACILISIIKNSKNNILKSFGIDISKDALEVAKINIDKHNLQDKVKLLEGNLLETLLKTINYKLKTNLVITANLPYIKDNDFENMDKNVIRNEPKIALFGGEKTGFELYEKLIEQIIEIQKSIKNKIILFIEIGFDQKQYAENYLTKKLLQHNFYKDNNGIQRCIEITFK